MALHKITLFNKLKEKSFRKKVIISIILIFVFIIGSVATRYILLVRQADGLVLSKNYDKAIVVYKQVVYMPGVKPKLFNAEKFQDSANAFKIGMKYFDGKDYKSSFTAFQSVIKEDSENYKIAIRKIIESKKLYITTMVTTASTFASNQDYTTAIS